MWRGLSRPTVLGPVVLACCRAVSMCFVHYVARPGSRGRGRSGVALLTVLSVAGCANQAPPSAPLAPAAEFLAAIAGMCGKAFAGKVVANEPAIPNDPFEGRVLVMHVRACDAAGGLRVPFHVGDDRSRTWVLTLVGDRLRLKHDHRHKDGTEDSVTQYGGVTTTPGTATRQEFPVDEFSRA